MKKNILFIFLFFVFFVNILYSQNVVKYIVYKNIKNFEKANLIIATDLKIIGKDKVTKEYASSKNCKHPKKNEYALPIISTIDKKTLKKLPKGSNKSKLTKDWIKKD